MPICRNCPDPQRPAFSKNYETNAHIERRSEGVVLVPLRVLGAERAPPCRWAQGASGRNRYRTVLPWQCPRPARAPCYNR
jgi:hypothetical protein